MADRKITNISISEDKKTITLYIENIPYGKYTITIKGVSTSEGHIADDTFTFFKSNIEAVYASGYQENSDNYPENVIDYDLATRWSMLGDDEWLLLKLIDTLTVTSIDMAFYNGNQRTAYFDVSIASDSGFYTNEYSYLSQSSDKLFLKFKTPLLAQRGLFIINNLPLTII